jgi:hypothetical protein
LLVEDSDRWARASERKSSTRFTWTGLSETGFRVSERRDHVDATPPCDG